MVRGWSAVGQWRVPLDGCEVKDLNTGGKGHWSFCPSVLSNPGQDTAVCCCVLLRAAACCCVLLCAVVCFCGLHLTRMSVTKDKSGVNVVRACGWLFILCVNSCDKLQHMTWDAVRRDACWIWCAAQQRAGHNNWSIAVVYIPTVVVTVMVEVVALV